MYLVIHDCTLETAGYMYLTENLTSDVLEHAKAGLVRIVGDVDPCEQWNATEDKWEPVAHGRSCGRESVS